MVFPRGALLPGPWILAALLAMACAKKPRLSEEGADRSEAAPTYAAEYDDAPMQKMAPAAPARRSRAAAAGALKSTAAFEAPPPEAAEARMVSHSGNIALRAPEPEAVLDRAESLVQAMGGYVETRSRGYLQLQVPAARFDSAFEALLGLADVVHYAQSAEDITAEFRDTDLRQKVVGAAVARLEALIERARNDMQRLRLLGELKRYREEWETLEARKKALRKRAEFASLELQVQGHAPAIAQGEDDFPVFAWIRRLDPFQPPLDAGSKLRFTVPAGLVATSEKGLWRATASEGAEMWARTLKSPLRGDSRFWRAAVLRRLKPQFKAADTLEAGGFLFSRFTSHGPRTYSYWVGVQAVEDCGVRVVELYFPDEKQMERHAEAMLAAVKKGPRKWYQRS